MNDIRDLLPNRMRERTFQLKAKRDAGAVWHEPQFVECKQCGRRAARTLWARSLYVCPNCGYHMPIGGYYRLSLVLDHGSFRELDADLDPQDVLNFPGYGEKLAAAQNKTGLHEAAVTAVGRIGGVACVAVLGSRMAHADHPFFAIVSVSQPLSTQRADAIYLLVFVMLCVLRITLFTVLAAHLLRLCFPKLRYTSTVCLLLMLGISWGASAVTVPDFVSLAFLGILVLLIPGLLLFLPERRRQAT